MIFLSYRREDTKDVVQHLARRLKERYGDAAVFCDTRDIASGEYWDDTLRAKLVECTVLVAMIGDKWLRAQDKAGRRRLDKPDDWVRNEIDTAIRAKDEGKKQVFVVLVNGATMPAEDDLPQDCRVKDLHRIQSKLQLHHSTFERDLAELLALLDKHVPPLSAASPPSPAAPAVPSLPAKPAVCVGRDDLLKKLETLFLPADLAAPLPRFAIAGIGGIGKSTAVLWFLHDPRVRERYGDHRHFVPLDGATSRAGVAAKLAECLGVEAGPNLEPRVLAELERGGRRLLVLDNAETPLQSDDRPRVEELLGSLAHLANVGLVATLRPNTRLPNWDEPETVDQLHPPHDLEAFHTHSGNVFRKAAEAAGFVTALDGWPIVLRLAANHARGYRTVAEFRTVWDRKRAELLAKGPDRATNLAVSVGLSLDALRRENPNGERLLATLARLPDGLLHEDVPGVLGDDGVETAAAVRTVGGLTIEDGERMRMLAPLRDHLQPLIAWADADRERAVRFYCGVATEGQKVGFAEAHTAIARLSPRVAGCIAMIELALTSPQRNLAYAGAMGMAEFARFTGLDIRAVLAAAAKSASEHGVMLAEAGCSMMLGANMMRRSELTEGRRYLERALALFRRLRIVNGQADCIVFLGEIALLRAEYPAARRRFEEALQLYRKVGSHLGRANCLLNLGDCAMEQSDPAEARRRFEQALPLYVRVKDVTGQGNCTMFLGRLALLRQQYGEARSRFEQAMALSHRAGDSLGQANCLRGLGDVAHGQGDDGTARAKYLEALALCRRVGVPDCTAQILHSLARITDAGAERAEYVAGARAAWRGIERADRVSQLDKEFPPASDAS